MNHHTDDVPAFEKADHEHEWLVQEEALRRERLGLGADGADTHIDDYRMLAKSLRQPLMNELPSDFARQITLRITAMTASTRFEHALMTALITIMMITTFAIIYVYGNEWMPSFNDIISVFKLPGSSWVMALIGCVSASWVGGQVQRDSHDALPSH